MLGSRLTLAVRSIVACKIVVRSNKLSIIIHKLIKPQINTKFDSATVICPRASRNSPRLSRRAQTTALEQITVLILALTTTFENITVSVYA